LAIERRFSAHIDEIGMFALLQNLVWKYPQSTWVMRLFLQANTNSCLYNNGFLCAPEIFAYPKEVN
jgi:hypothetical protein